MGAVQYYFPVSTMVSLRDVSLLPVVMIVGQIVHQGGHLPLHPTVHVPHPLPPHSVSHPTVPYNPQPKSYCDPSLPPKCAEASHLPYCIPDPEYPAYDIAHIISKESLFPKKYTDLPDQSAYDLLQYITKEQEEHFDYSLYTGASRGPSPFDVSHWVGPEGYLCPSLVDYAKITRAQSVEGYWRVILQHIPEGPSYGHYNYTQTTRLETCLTPDSACRLLAPCYKSQCTQKYTYHRMLSLDPCDPYRGFFIDTYKLPSACSCHLPSY